MDGSAVIVSWVTQDEPGSNTVLYGTSEDNFEFHATGKLTQYTYYNYTSGFIHHCTLRNLKVCGYKRKKTIKKYKKVMFPSYSDLLFVQRFFFTFVRSTIPLLMLTVFS